ncbi:protein ALP1-like [Cryptotermes secundus]|nr:protein ALP1-like [Cryptotermes secundus]
MPQPDEDMWVKIEDDFCKKWNFPNLLGAIGGKHMLIQAPPHSGSQYFCYKKVFSIALSALVDASYKFIFIDVGAYGTNSDSSIFKRSALGTGLENNTLNIPTEKQLPGSNTTLPHVIVGDEAFPLRTYLMTPFSRDQARGNEERKVFNYRLSQVRNVSENSFGILVRKFRIFEHRLSLSHEHANCVILAACILHNYLRHDNCYWSENDLQVAVSDMQGLRNLERCGGPPPQAALHVRDAFTNYFNSEAGPVEWQAARIQVGKRNIQN